jgi:hypothetical protein
MDARVIGFAKASSGSSSAVLWGLIIGLSIAGLILLGFVGYGCYLLVVKCRDKLRHKRATAQQSEHYIAMQTRISDT